MGQAGNDSSAVRIFPPFIYAGLFALGYSVHRFVPAHLWPDGPPPAARAAAWALLVVWLGLSASAVFLFRRAGTTPNPSRPTTAIVVHGPFRFTRNPMYVSLVALYLSLTLFVNSVWPLVLLPVVIALVQRQVIAREEAYLEAKFGDEYRAYKARVRRWL
ncbi:MAG: isoprenylcysteine carboxyl methyltransferase [Gemmatimonadetes bacterium]|nr:MAG: isoprenylcysteine carboxyl methyltransferase [Gemmatimonadota bacterium]TLY55717.1 MAG: isoprenylcysteine carboxylmethyltransferase family protein [Gemmatimonadota bacterium]